MTLRSLFDKDRREGIQKAIEKGEPLPFQRNKGTGLAEGPNPDIRAFMRDLRASADPTKQRLERANAFMRKKVEEIDRAHSEDEFNDAEASADQKRQQAKKGVNVSYTPLEQTIVDLLEFNKLVVWLEKQVKVEDGLRAVLGTSGKSGKVGP